MNAIKRARRLIAEQPMQPQSKVLAQLVLALESNEPISLGPLYELQMDQFELALQMLKEWRLDRYYMGKARLLDLSLQARELGEPGAA